MAEVVTIARPYAEAINRLAAAANNYDQWSDMLAFTAAVASDATMSALIDDPNVSHKDLERAFLTVCEGRLSDEGRNLIKVLLENGRLNLLPAIQETFEALKAARQGVLEATITSAFPLDDQQFASLRDKLEARFGRRVDAAATVDPELIGGVCITVGDVVLDSSVRGQLQQMAFNLKR